MKRLSPIGSLPSIRRVLEKRILLDAAAVVAATEVIDPAAVNVTVDEAQPKPVEAEPAAVTEENNSETAKQDGSDREIAFIDTTVENYQQLIEQLDPNIEIILLNASMDGIEKITNVLAGANNIQAIHIISHGNSAELQLGGTLLTTESIQTAHADALKIIGESLTDSADILIYGCNFGAGSEGELAANALADATGADIAASNDLTGDNNLGGDWDLELQIGNIEAQTFNENLSEINWDSLLNISVNSSLSVSELAELLSTDNGITIVDNSASVSSGSGMIGSFTDSNSNAGFGSGIVISTGQISDLNQSQATTASGVGSGNNVDDSDLAALDVSSLGQNDVATFSYQFTSGSEKVAVTFSFSSEDYFELVSSGLKDVFGIFVSGANPSGGSYNAMNIGVVPGTSTSIDIDSVNTSTNSGYFNSSTTDPFVMDGVTTSITSTFDVTPGETYTIKFAIADLFNNATDSALFVNTVAATPYIDLDLNNSTATSTGYQNSFEYGSGAVSIVDSDLLFNELDPSASIQSAVITLTNAKTGDDLDTSGITGLTVNKVSAGGQITVTLSGSSSTVDYTNALKAITFNNATSSADTSDRVLTFSATDGSANSNTATATIAFNYTAPPASSATTLSTDGFEFYHPQGGDSEISFNDGISLQFAHELSLQSSSNIVFDLPTISSSYLNITTETSQSYGQFTVADTLIEQDIVETVFDEVEDELNLVENKVVFYTEIFDLLAEEQEKTAE